MPKGKQTCKILKEIRKQIAAENNIELVVSECTYQGDCAGTCPRCEAEVRYLERELEKQQRLGKAVMISGLAVTTMLGVASSVSCHRLEGDVPNPVIDDTVAVPLEGDVCAPVDTTSLFDEYMPLPGELVNPKTSTNESPK